MLPAVATLDELRTRSTNLEALWIGSFDGVEAETATRAGIGFAPIPTGKLRRYADPKTVRDAANIPRGYWAARRLVREF